jgi:hypothetical protein
LLVIGYAILPFHIAADFLGLYEFTRNVLITVPCIILAATLTVVGAAMAGRSDRAIPLSLLMFFVELAVYAVTVLFIFSGQRY